MSAALEREWRRYTRAERLGRFALYFGVVAACVVSLRTVQIIPEFLYDAPEQMADLLRRMWPIEWSYYPGGVHDALIETLHIATLGTILSVFMAVPLGIMAAHNIVRSTPINYAAKFLLVSSRCSVLARLPARSPSPSARSASPASSLPRHWKRRTAARSRR